MALVEIMSVNQPCVLCELPLEVWTLHRDTDTGEERYEVDRLDHECEMLKALIRERYENSPIAR